MCDLCALLSVVQGVKNIEREMREQLSVHILYACAAITCCHRLILSLPDLAIAIAFICEGTAMIGGRGTSPIRVPVFEKIKRFHLKADLPHSYSLLGTLYFLNTRVVRIEIRAYLKITFYREMLKWHCPTPPNFCFDGQMLDFLS